MSLILRYMRSADVTAVVEIDRASFDPPWPARSYNFEINQSSCSYMLVLERVEIQTPQGFRRLLNNLRSGDNHVERRVIVGYGGLWKIQEEAHISTIATRPQYRGRGYGELLLAGMVQKAIALRAAYVVLEVRVSNRVAQSLYQKHHFTIAGTKPNYYRNNSEDAYDMRLQLDEPGAVVRANELYERLQARHRFTDAYSRTPHPRLG